MTDVTRVRLEERRIHPLGRHVEHDPRSLQFAYEAPRNVVLRTVTHSRVGGIFDQGSLGSCTGNAVAGACNTKPTYVAGKHPVLGEADAIACYELATIVDGFPGQYPPDDTGSSGLAACKAAKAKGWISSYQHAFDVSSALAALMTRPICLGVSWHEGFDRPDAHGFVSASGEVRGGHEFVVRGFDATSPRASSRLLWADNSWGAGWGAKGRFCFNVATFEQLLAEQGDVVIPVRS